MTKKYSNEHPYTNIKTKGIKKLTPKENNELVDMAQSSDEHPCQDKEKMNCDTFVANAKQSHFKK